MGVFNETFPSNVNIFVDLFCGGGSVGLSANAKKVFFIDNNKHVISLLEHLAKYKLETLLGRLGKLIADYKLSYSAEFGYAKYRKGIKKEDNNGLKAFNEKGFYKLRKNYNLSKNKFSKKSLDMLYLLLVYGFNNDLRFNGVGDYNLPAGKTDLNKSNIRKLEAYIERVDEIECVFVCADFRDTKVRKILSTADFIYADPPYLLGNAVYNENGNWTDQAEDDLMELLGELKEVGTNFALSNVLEKRNPASTNMILKKWLDRQGLKMHDIKYHYKSSSYNKKNRNACEREVLVTNL